MVGIIDEAQLFYPLGTRIKIADNYGTVRYVGETQTPTAGSFIRPGKVGPCATLEDAARERYLNYDSSNVDESLIREAQASLQASLFEVVGMDKIARKQSKFEQLAEVSVEQTSVNAAGYLKELTHLTTLNVSHTLIWNWEIVASIAQQLPSLNSLDLSSNRLVLPLASQITDLEPAFRQLKRINLGSCGFTNWKDVMQTALLWPNILSLGLQDNSFGHLDEVDGKIIFKRLQELYLHRTNIMDFDQVAKLGKLTTLRLLNLMENGIEEIRLLDCDPQEKLNIFVSLEQLNLLHNPIWNEADTFNELDKLPKLKRLSKTPHLKSNFDEMVSKAVASIAGLQFLNNAEISPEKRRGAEYDIWKKYALDWMQATNQGSDSLREFCRKHRTYPLLITKYGSPVDFIPRSQAKQSNLINICIRHQLTGETWEKKVPRMITVQTLQGLVIKRFRLSGNVPQLSYVDARHPDLVVPLDNNAKTLDFYSVQEHDTVLVR
ncbi:tubulin-specific chaperone E isoform X2 [Drosophila eugracilis]|uniref:tubulin-specific chaperone E isoform X2 n=1 Tax=Drosophila eugracilis TaxID=29029 RepID=UPI0007E89572|nr:tubulin-specific chaperone E isoform X2 [Drosophila eugracilis]